MNKSGLCLLLNKLGYSSVHAARTGLIESDMLGTDLSYLEAWRVTNKATPNAAQTLMQEAFNSCMFNYNLFLQYLVIHLPQGLDGIEFLYIPVDNGTLQEFMQQEDL